MPWNSTWLWKRMSDSSIELWLKVWTQEPVWIQIQLCYRLAVWPWAAYSTSLCLSLSIYKMLANESIYLARLCQRLSKSIYVKGLEHCLAHSRCYWGFAEVLAISLVSWTEMQMVKKEQRFCSVCQRLPTNALTSEPRIAPLGMCPKETAVSLGKRIMQRQVGPLGPVQNGRKWGNGLDRPELGGGRPPRPRARGGTHVW